MYYFLDEKENKVFCEEYVFVKKLSNGKMGLCEENEAEGITVKGRFWPFEKLGKVSDSEYRTIKNKEQEEKITELEMAVAQLSVIAAGGKAEDMGGVEKAWENLIKKGKLKAEDIPDLDGLKEKVLFRLEGEE